MPKVPMEASRSMTYNTRRLKAGDVFDARNELDAKILAHRRLAHPYQAPMKLKEVAQLVKKVETPPVTLKIETPSVTDNLFIEPSPKETSEIGEKKTKSKKSKE